MVKNLFGFLLVFFLFNLAGYCQVDTSYVYNTNVPYGVLDIRIAKSATNYYYLQEDQTFSFRESAPGVKTNTYFDMTSWDSSPYKQGHLREKTNAGDNFVMNYRLLIPDGYNPAFAEGYPIAMIMHGFGESANCQKLNCYHADRTYSPITNDPAAPADSDSPLLNNDHNLLHGGRHHLGAMQKAGGKLPGDPSLDPRAFPGFVLFPQNLSGWTNFTAQDAIRILRLLIKKYNIDEDRVYIEGISNGGQGMFECLKRAPWLFTAAIGMSSTNDGYINAQGVAPSVAHIPVWLFQGGLDEEPYPSTTERYIQQFRNAGMVVRYTVYPELGHGTWNKAFTEPDFIPFLLGNTKADLHSFEGTNMICSDQGTRLELPKGYLAYQWQRNGQTIAGADSALFYARTAGKYRARFARVSNPTEAQWNQWSKEITLTVTSPPQANISQIGTVVLKDLNGYADARLQSLESHAHYYWYKNAALLDLPGTADDTLQVATITPNYGNGAYTLVVADHGCKSAPTAPKYIFFNDSAPVNITAPAAPAGISTSPAENTITWKDASNNEGGFEIWKRKASTNGTSFPWVMAGITGANVTTFDDTGVEPTVNYQYKIRAVSNTGRSNYTPSPVNDGIAVQTIVDTEPPGAPTELKAVYRGVQKILLTWKPSTDNTRIREYIVQYNGTSVATASADTTFLLTALPLNAQFDITVKGKDLSGNLSPVSNSVKMNTYFGGLYYEHTTGLWTDLDSVDWTWAEFRGKVSEFTLRTKTQDDFFNMSFDGFLLLENGGTYQFRTGSDDGSRLWLNGNLLVNNDGVHNFKIVTSAGRSLQKGPQRIYVQFFDYIESDSLLVEYNGPDTGNKWTKITSDVLKSDASVVTAIGPASDNGPEDSFRLSVYPNPTTQDNINILVETVVTEPVQVRLLDPVGRNLFEGIFQPEEITGGISLSPPGIMNTGMYVVMVRQGSVVVRQKVIVKR
ncbi:MAG: prolyl oligopeptidase family serine peptidase [Cyclobacteriaceae bacterium]